MFQDHDIVNAKEIAEMLFASTGTFVHQQRAIGRFPAPSWVTPGNGGRHVWLRRTVDLWLVEYLSRTDDIVLASKGSTKSERRAANAAAETATKIAEAFDKKLKQEIINQRDARSEPARESNNERVHPASMVAA